MTSSSSSNSCTGAGLGRPCRQHERQRHARQPAGEIDQPAQRGDIRPVRVVDGHQQRLCVGQIDGEPVEPVQGGKRRLGAGFRVGRKQDRLRQRRRPGQQGFTLLRVAGRHHRLQQLPDDPERQLALQLAAPRRQNAQLWSPPRSESPRADSICRSPPALRRPQPRLSPHGRRRATAPPFRARARAPRAEPAALPRHDSRAAPRCAPSVAAPLRR